MPPDQNNQPTPIGPTEPIIPSPMPDAAPAPSQIQPSPLPAQTEPLSSVQEPLSPMPENTFITPGQTFMPESQNVAVQPPVHPQTLGQVPAAKAPNVPQPQLQPQPVTSTLFQADPIQVPPQAPPHKKNRTKLFVGMAVLLILLLVGGYVFAFYIPNKPQNVYNTGLNRTGQALTQVINGATEQKSLQTLKSSDVSASIDGTMSGTTYSGSLDVKYNSSKAAGNLTATVKQDGQPDKTVSTKFIGELPAGTEFPNIYVQLSGLKALGLSDLIPSLDKIDGQWVSIDANYLKSLGYAPSSAQNNATTQLGAADIASLAKTLASVTTEYVLTSNPKKAVIEQKKYVGKETVDGIKTYHYQIGINKVNAKAYCDALITQIYANPAAKKLPGYDAKTADTDKAKDISDCQQAVSTIKDDTTYDMWVDAKYKLIHKIRVTDPSAKDTYTEFGQTYNGGDTVSLFVTYHNGPGKTDGNFVLDLNTKTYVTKATLTATNKDQGNPSDIKIVLSSQSYNGNIDVTKPASAIPLQDVLQQLGIDPSVLNTATAGTNQ